MMAVLLALFLLAVSLQGIMWVHSTQARRERERELLMVGSEIRKAIGSYVESSSGTQRTWPPTLEALLDDRRSVVLRRHLRRVYADPITGRAEWGVVRAPDGGIAGVFSLSEDAPVRTGGRELARYGVEPAARYSAWLFVYQPRPDAGGAL